ncbi:MAG: methionine adenosyltransferase, partial [Candidatus Nanohalobium sp.]
DEDPVRKRKTELVERKGVGHPDSICDGIAEAVSRKLSKEYRERFGHILHHNTDEVQLVAGESRPEFSGGEIVTPIKAILTGRATHEFQGEEVPVERLALEAARDYIDENFKVLSSEDFEFKPMIGETSTDLKAVFSDEKPLSNDTSFGVGHAPLSPVEKSVRKIEEEVRNINEVGEDVKVMALREDGRVKATVACAVIASRVDDREEYEEVLEDVEEKTRHVLENHGLEPEVHVNTADTEENAYITETGTSAEMGDDGSVGRGNRINGLITPHRSMSLEAASGKNPVTHVGKIYNFLAREIAEEINRKTGEFAEVKLLSQIGAPLDQPQNVEVQTGASREVVEEVVEEKLDGVEEITDSILDEKTGTF